MTLCKRLALFTVAALLGSPSLAMADCGSHRLVGDWRLYVHPNANSWMACELKVLPSGKMGRKSSCSGANLLKSPATGSLSVKDCVITGQFTVASQKYVIEHAGFNVDQSQIFGVMKLGAGHFTEFKSLRQ